MIKIVDVTKSFDTKCVLNIDRLEMNEGEIIGLVGNNGAGKTTLFRIILDLLKPDTGFVEIEGNDVSKTEEWKGNLGAFIDEGFLIEYLTPEEFFYFLGKVYGKSKNEIDSFLTNYTKLMNNEILKQNKYIRNFSSGNKQKIGIISSFINEPKIIILDEPFNYLDPTSQIITKEILKKYSKEKNSTVILSTHNINHVLDLCDRIVVLEYGKIIKDISSSENAEKELEEYFYKE